MHSITADRLLVNTLFNHSKIKTHIELETIQEKGEDINVETSYVKIKLKSFILGLITLCGFFTTIGFSVSQYYFSEKVSKLEMLVSNNLIREKIDSISVKRTQQIQDLNELNKALLIRIDGLEKEVDLKSNKQKE